MQTLVEVLVEGVFASAQKKAIAAKRLQSLKNFAQTQQSPSRLSEIELLLGCILLVQNMTGVFDRLLKSTPAYNTVLTNVYRILTNNLLTLTADMTAESGMNQTISSDLSAAAVQQTTVHLRNRITSCPTSVHCCLEVLMLLAHLDHTPEAVFSTFVRQGEPTLYA